MRTSLIARGGKRRRLVAIVAVVAMPLGILATSMGAASAHEAPGSPVEVFIDSTASADLNDAIQNGWWGHEGGAHNGTGTQPSILDLNGSDPDLSSTFPDLSKIRVAFVATSSDGSAEKPSVSVGETVDQAFTWFADAGLQTGFNTNPDDSITTISTGTEYDNWFAAGQPVQGYDASLVSHDVNAPGSPTSAAPKGKSILNRWPAGSHISLVFYATTGANVNGKPVVARDSNGKAITAYMPFTTVAKPSAPSVRTSAGYSVVGFGAVAQDTTTTLATDVASPQPAGTPVALTATVAPASGTDVPVGSVEFFDGSTSLGTKTLTAGTATLSGQTFAVGSHTLKAVYTPTNTQTLAFNASTSANKTFVTSATATTTALSATPGADVTAPVGLTATVTPTGVTGSVVFKDGGVTIAGPTAINASGIATATKTFSTPGVHNLTAEFTPDAASSSYAGSTGSVQVNLAAPTGVSVDTQTVTGTIPVGTITVTTPYTPASPLDLGQLALTPALDGYKASATFKDIHVLDTRSGAQHWDLTALAGNLSDGAGHFINGQNLGLTGLAPETTDISGAPVTNNPGLGTITATNNPVPAAPVAPGDTGSLGLGGSTPHNVLHATQGPSDAWYSGTLTLFAPTTSVTGLYTGTITFTAS